MKRRSRQELSLKECYGILQLSPGASLDDVKHAYRVRAFELHPDLNPANPRAANDFQKLNEAYVLLSAILKEEEAKNAARAEADARRREEAARAEEERLAREKARQEKRAEREKAREEQWAAREKAKEEERAAREKAREEERAAREKARAEEQAEQERKAREEEERAENERKRGEARQAEGGAAAEEEAGRKRAAESAYGQGDVLRDLLDDPFARRVFEDIYSEINRQGAQNAQGAPKAANNDSSPPSYNGWSNGSANGAANGSPAREGPTRTLKFEWGDNKSNVNFKNGVKGAVKGWLRSQIDEEQTFKLPASNLFPGARIRLRIRRGFSEELTTIEIVLPRDFVIGKPVRLRGLGKKVGPWQGDMYLKLEAAQ